jgi:hypothetical protein
VAVISESMATFFESDDVGNDRIDSDARFEVIGVAADVRANERWRERG